MSADRIAVVPANVMRIDFAEADEYRAGRVRSDPEADGPLRA